MDYVIIIGVFQALLALSLFVVYKRRRPAEKVLTLLLICIFTHLSLKFVIYALSEVAEFKSGFNTFIDLAYGPLLWMYASKIKDHKFKTNKYFFLLLPASFAAIVYLYILYCGLSGSHAFKTLTLIYNHTTTYLISVSMVILPCLSYAKAKNLSSFWKAERILIKRISVLFILIGGISLTINLITAFKIYDLTSLHFIVRITCYGIMSNICLLILYYKIYFTLENTSGMLDFVNIKSDAHVEVIQHEDNPEGIKQLAQSDIETKKALLNQERQAAIIEDVHRLMQIKKVYSDPELSLEKLSAISKIPRHHLSEAFNQYLGKSFYQLVNEFRIKEVIRSLDEYKKRDITPNILLIAYESGFNSKSTFNHYFRKIAGSTPSAYLKRTVDENHVGTGTVTDWYELIS